MGSSPHTRGARPGACTTAANFRIIPAYAGSTSRSSRRRWLGSGSSPHTRGAHEHAIVVDEARWIIPAYAGSTCGAGGRRTGSPDHPRIRGEHASPRFCQPPRAGSSPHTRGARHLQSEIVVGRRIIPAYAGSTDAAVLQGGEIVDHPRIRGEHDPRRRGSPAARGSSPHTRGAPVPNIPSLKPGGIIPAYAGSTTP